jgi:hypothetical protein
VSKVTFKYSDETGVYPKLIEAVNKLCEANGKDCLCTSGYRSLDKQKIINKQALNDGPGRTQRADGSVYDKYGKCWAAAYGKSNHCYGMALDITDTWFKGLANTELSKYGLIKPLDYEPWHIELIETRKLTENQKPAFYFQYTHGLVADGIAGPKTKAKVQEVHELINKILKGVK